MTDRLRLAAQALVDRQDFWRNAGTLPGEYDNLVDALAEPAEPAPLPDGPCPTCGSRYPDG